MSEHRDYRRSGYDRLAAKRMHHMWPISALGSQAETTDCALAALGAGVSWERVATTFGAPAAERARLAVDMRSPATSAAMAARLRTQPTDRFIARLESEVLQCFDAGRSGAGSAMPEITGGMVNFQSKSKSKRANSNEFIFSLGRRNTAALAVAATVLVALFARIGSDSIRGIDAPATAVAATGTTTIGTPIALGTEVPMVAHMNVDG